MRATRKQIADIFSTGPESIRYTEGIKDQNTKDTYEFTAVGVSFDKINRAIKEIPNLKLGDSIITSTKVVLRIG